MVKKIFTIGLFSILLGNWLQMAKLNADDTAGGLAGCYADCETDWWAQWFYCLAWIENLAECRANNDAALVACKKGCDRKYE